MTTKKYIVYIYDIKNMYWAIVYIGRKSEAMEIKGMYNELGYKTKVDIKKNRV